jgi:GT2 family glycosyltransferase
VPAQPSATVVVVSRDRWSLAPATLATLLERTDVRHPVVVVDGAAPTPVAAAFDRLAAEGRVRVVRRGRFLAGNEARNVGADRARTEWVAFVENDTVLSAGWLERLLTVGEAEDAASAYPAYVQPEARGAVVHGLGADVEVVGPEGAAVLREHHTGIGSLWRDVADHLVASSRVQAEPHAIVIRREFLEQIGGFDEGLLGWFDHTDLGLHHRRHGVESWCVPDVTCLYLAPPPVAFRDVPTFALRWGSDWYDRSLTHLCETWGLDRHDGGWDEHERYRREVRRAALGPWSKLGPVAERAMTTVEHAATRRWDARRARA